jgi:hypothetical protein
MVMAFNESWLHLLGLADLIMSLTLESEDLVKTIKKKKKSPWVNWLKFVSINTPFLLSNESNLI